jgi:5-methylcytosine-specific restriction endonuclease McrA
VATDRKRVKAESDRRYYEAHRDEVVARAKAWATAHPEKRRAIARKWERAWRIANPDAARARIRASHATHRDSELAYRRIYNQAHRDDLLAAGRAYNEAHRQERRAYSAAYRKLHPEECLARSHVWRARLVNASGTHTAKEWREKIELLGGCCVYCGRSDRPLSRDHKTPLSRGGSNAIENIVPACRSCNSRKRTLTAPEFIARRAA